MESGQKPKWTKDDTRLCAEMGVALVGFGAFLGWLHGDGLFWGAVGGAGGKVRAPALAREHRPHRDRFNAAGYMLRARSLAVASLLAPLAANSD
jgi:hypothetical protein